MYRRKTPGHPRINRSEIKDTQKCKQFNHEATNVILAPTSANEAWSTLHDGIYKAAIAAVGKSVKKNVDWFEANLVTLIPLVNEKITALLTYKTYPSIRNRESLQKYANRGEKMCPELLARPL